MFERECSGYPGFITKFRVTEKNSSSNETDTVDFENYRFVKWLNFTEMKVTVLFSGMSATNGIIRSQKLWWFVWKAKTLFRSGTA